VCLNISISGYKNPVTGILDKISGAGAAYSLRKLKSTATKAIRVRRSSDNAEKDIIFIGDNLDTVDLLSFVGSGNGYVTKWFDQSGYGNDLVQTTASAQPQIVSGGVYLNYVIWDTSDDIMTCSALCNTGFPQSEFSVFIQNIPVTGTILNDNGVFAKYYNSINTPFIKYENNNAVNYRLSYTSGTYNSYVTPINTVQPNAINSFCMTVKTGIGGNIDYYTNNDIYTASIANTSWVPNQTDFSFYKASNFFVKNLTMMAFNRKITEAEYKLLSKIN